MLQSIAAWLLHNYIGEYIENLNADQLTIGYGIFLYFIFDKFYWPFEDEVWKSKFFFNSIIIIQFVAVGWSAYPN